MNGLKEEKNVNVCFVKRAVFLYYFSPVLVQGGMVRELINYSLSHT